MRSPLMGLFLLIFFFLPLYTFSFSLEVPLTKDQKSLFYLDKATLLDGGVSITSKDSLLDASDQNDYSLITFEKNIPGFHNITLVSDAKSQRKSGLFFNDKSYIDVPFHQSLENGLIMDFWAKPLSTLKEEIVRIQYLSENGLNKEITVSMKKDHIQIQFEHMFSGSSDIKESKSLRLTSNIHILPGKWIHNRIIFTPNNGRLSYYCNGELDSETWATDSNMPGSSIWFFNIPKNPQVVLGSGYRGLIDQFIIGNNPTRKFSDTWLGYPQGNVYTRVLPLPLKSKIDSISVDAILPTDSDFITYYRISENPFNDNTPEEIIPWYQYNRKNPGKNLLMVGEYIQVRIQLIADPTINLSPLLKKISLTYSSFDVPLKPLDFRVYSSNGDIFLSLHPSINESIAAYKIYVGTKPNAFFGDTENMLQSPLIVPITGLEKNTSTNRLSYKISGLTPAKLYYFKITAVSTEGIESPFSETVKCRVRILV